MLVVSLLKMFDFVMHEHKKKLFGRKKFTERCLTNV